MWYRGRSVGTRLLSILPVSLSPTTVVVSPGVPPTGSRHIPHFVDTPVSKQTLPLKAFLVTTAAIFGFTLSADSALLKFETRQRIEEAAVRKQARMGLAKQGLVPTETEIARWREANGK